MDTIVFEKSERQMHAAQGERYADYPGYHIWIKYGRSKEMFYLAYIEQRLLETAMYFYMKEDDLAVVVIDGDNQVRFK